MATPTTDAPQEIHEDELAGMGPGTIPEKPAPVEPEAK